MAKKIRPLKFVDIYRRVRKKWLINPATRVLESKKKGYRRGKMKQETRKIIQEQING